MTAFTGVEVIRNWLRPRPGGRRVRPYRTLASSVAKALRGVCSRSFRRASCGRDVAGCASGIGRCDGAAAAACCGARRVLPFRGLRRVGPQKPVFQGGAIEAANNRLHLVGGRRFDKSEALGFLRFVVADHLNGVGHKSSAASHCLMSSAVTQVGRLPRKTVKLIQLIIYSVGWICGTSREGFRLPTR